MAKRSRSASPCSVEIDDPCSHPATTNPDNHAVKYAQLDDHAEMTNTTMRCHLPPHAPLTFPSQLAYETHYNASHFNRCTACRKNFPTMHFLHLHIAENHDPLNSARQERGDKIFACFVEGCEKACADWKKRRSHLVDKHGFPKNYDFFVVDSGIEGKRSLLRAGVDEGGHRASSREREREGGGRVEGECEGEDEGMTLETEAASVSPPPMSEGGGSQARSVEDVAKANVTIGKQQWRGKKRSASTRLSIGGPPIAPVKTGMDDMVKSMSALSFVPRSVQRKG